MQNTIKNTNDVTQRHRNCLEVLNDVSNNCNRVSRHKRHIIQSGGSGVRVSGRVRIGGDGVNQ